MNQLDERRKEIRHQFIAPLVLTHGVGITRDFSLSGVYFTTNVRFEPGEDLQFVFNMQYALPDRNVPLDCQGQVLRVEKIGGDYGVAARIDNIKCMH
jgi:hypothetical protein